MGRYLIKTLGCKANLYDTQQLEAEFEKEGWTPQLKSEATAQTSVDVCVINSCTVTNEADKQSRKLATQLSRQYPQASIVMTGCGAEVNPEAMARTPGVSYVVGNQDKRTLVSLVRDHIQSSVPSSTLTSHIQNPKILGSTSNYKEILSKHPTEREWPAAVDSFGAPSVQFKTQSTTTRAFLKIQEGCDAFCTYCIIPYGRGPSRSLKPHQVVQQIQSLVSEGVKEVVITGTNIGEYGGEWKKLHHSSETNSSLAKKTPSVPLDDLLQMILEQTSIERLRVSSLDPTEITPRMLELMRQYTRFCPHFHVSLQSPHSRILKLMKRGYDFEDVKRCLTAIQTLPSPPGGVFVGMDIIAGFPGETEEEFAWTYDALASLPWSRLHVFPYSERNGTPATRLPGSVAQSVRVDRTRKLNALSMMRLEAHYRNLLNSMREEGDLLPNGKCTSNETNEANSVVIHQVLFENTHHPQWHSGYSANYLRVLLPAHSGVQRNEVASVHPLEIMVDKQAHDVAFISRLIN